MQHSNITTVNTEFILISFEGPDCYSLAGGLGVRMQNLSQTLADVGFTTHLIFIGDPNLPAQEVQGDGHLILHRWCQWISKYHPGGVYDGEEGKLADFNRTVPPYIVENIVRPAVDQDKLVVILGEEWQMADTICQISDLLYNVHLKGKAILFWNANNTISFHRINWGRLNYTATITTISRYMKHIMERMGLNPLVIPNGIPMALLRKVDDRQVTDLRAALGGKILLCKVARWDPDKNWMGAVEATSKLKDMGLNPVLLARGGKEPYGQEVINRALSLHLDVKQAQVNPNEHNGFLDALARAMPSDVIDIRFQLPLDFLVIMYRAADAVLANSGHEPFGIVGLEAMAAGGIVFTGSTGEDYSIPFVNSFMIETSDPMEIVSYIVYLQSYPQQMERMRNSARLTARYYTWEAAVQNLIGKLENQGRIQGTLSNTLVTQISTVMPAELVIAERVWKVPPENNNEKALRNNRCIS